jgi:hypothetical protein
MGSYPCLFPATATQMGLCLPGLDLSIHFPRPGCDELLHLVLDNRRRKLCWRVVGGFGVAAACANLLFGGDAQYSEQRIHAVELVLKPRPTRTTPGGERDETRWRTMPCSHSKDGGTPATLLTNRCAH